MLLASVASQVQGSEARRVDMRDVRPRVEEHFNKRVSCLVQVLRPEGGVTVEDRIKAAEVPACLSAGHQQWCTTMAVHRVHVCSAIQQQLCHICPTAPANSCAKGWVASKTHQWHLRPLWVLIQRTPHFVHIP